MSRVSALLNLITDDQIKQPKKNPAITDPTTWQTVVRSTTTACAIAAPNSKTEPNFFEGGHYKFIRGSLTSHSKLMTVKPSPY